MKLILSLALSLLPCLASANTERSVDELKTQILALAKQNTSNNSNRVQIRAELDGLVAEIASHSIPVDEAKWAQYAPGSWRQIWSDEADNSPAGSPQLDLEKIFQVLRADGRGVNYGERIMPDGSRVTFALGVVGTVVSNVQDTTIVSAFYRPSALGPADNLVAITEDILAGKQNEFKEVKAGTFPNGPINANSKLTLLYLDDTLKIGTAPNVYSGVSEMFIVERLTAN